MIELMGFTGYTVIVDSKLGENEIHVSPKMSNILVDDSQSQRSFGGDRSLIACLKRILKREKRQSSLGARMIVVEADEYFCDQSFIGTSFIPHYFDGAVSIYDGELLIAFIKKVKRVYFADTIPLSPNCGSTNG